MIDRKAYIEKMKAQMDEWDQNLAKLEAKAEDARDEMKQYYDDQMVRLKAQQEEAREMLDKMSAASEAAWEDMRKGMETAWETTSKAFMDAFSRFK